MTRRPFLTALALAALLAAGCGGGSSDSAGTDTGSGSAAASGATQQTKAVRFAECMRDNGVPEFPDPDPSGELTVDGVLNGSSLDPDAPGWDQAMDACKALQPAGFTGRKATPEEQDGRLAFAQCMRDNGIEDFPDPEPDGPLIDTTRIPSAEGRGALSIPGFKDAQEKCGEAFTDEQLGLDRP